MEKVPGRLSEQEDQELKNLSMRVRENIVRMSTDGGCFLGASLSAVDIIVYLYQKYLRIPSLQDPKRDYFFSLKATMFRPCTASLQKPGKLKKSV
jgi:transketolase